MPDTLDQLRELPDLAAECWVTWDAPNPAQRAARGTRQLEPPAPTNLAAYDTLRTDEHGQLFRITQCVRTVVETMPTHPDDLAETPTWASESAWLIRHADFWQADQWCSEYVTSEVTQVHAHLQRAVRTPEPVRLVCPECQARARVRDDWLVCDEGHQRPVGGYAKRLQDREPIGTTQAATEFGITPERIWKWRERGFITPALTVGRASLWRPWDIFRQLHPELAKDLREEPVEVLS